jgi:TrmH family RNA methyltransferase
MRRLFVHPDPVTITSAQNARLKQIRKLRQRRRWRERDGVFVAEGEDLLAAADGAGWLARERYCAAGSGLAGVEVEPRVLNAAAGLASGTRALAIYEERWLEAPAGPLCVYLHGVRDPGNVGAILRAAHAFGASCVALGPGSADPFSPKAVRASMGAIFHVPLARAAGTEALPGVKVALAPDRGTELRRAVRELAAGGSGRDLELTLIVGAEREGLPEDALRDAHVRARIPIRGDSLNAAMAATVALYELSRIARA